MRRALDPALIPSLDASEVLETLDLFLSTFPARGSESIGSGAGRRALVFGDTHSDWPTVQELCRTALPPSSGLGCLIGLGDYVDRAPPELPFGSLVNALYLLSLRLSEPERVYLLRGNHETQRLIPILRNEVVDEADQLWGHGSGVGTKVLDAFDRLPLAATTESGAYLAHGGFPRGPYGEASWRSALERPGLSTVEEVVWNDLEVSSFAGGRGLELPPITEAETLAFLKEAGCTVFLRGHDPTEAGRARYQDRVLTLHTSRVYDWAGLHVAEVPLDGRVRDLRDVVHRTMEPPPIPDVSLPKRRGAYEK